MKRAVLLWVLCAAPLWAIRCINIKEGEAAVEKFITKAISSEGPHDGKTLFFNGNVNFTTGVDEIEYDLGIQGKENAGVVLKKSPGSSSNFNPIMTSRFFSFTGNAGAGVGINDVTFNGNGGSFRNAIGNRIGQLLLAWMYNPSGINATQKRQDLLFTSSPSQLEQATEQATEQALEIMQGGGAVEIGEDFTGGISHSIFLDNITAKLGGPAFGGAVASLGNFSGGISNSRFTKNAAVGPLAAGGAVFALNLEGGIDSSAFVNNLAFGLPSILGNMNTMYAKKELNAPVVKYANPTVLGGSNSGSSGWGPSLGGAVGAVAIDGGVHSSSFENNSAGSGGGAIGCVIFEGKIDNSRFEGNSSGDRLAVVDADQAATGQYGQNRNTLRKILASTGNGSGGALCILSLSDLAAASGLGERITEKLSIGADIGTTIINQLLKALSSKCGGSFSGAVQNSQFLHNRAGKNGGAISCHGVFTGYEDGGFADLGNSYFLKNEAGDLGGGIYVDGTARLVAGSGNTIIRGNRSHMNSSVPAHWDEPSPSVSNVAKDAAPLDTVERGRPSGLHFVDNGGDHNNSEILNFFSDFVREMFVDFVSLPEAVEDIIVRKNLTKHDYAIGAKRHNTFFLYDPITCSGNPSAHPTLDLNPEGTHVGTVLFDRYRSELWDNCDVTVWHGTLTLQNGASLGAERGQGTFRLEEPATLRIAYGQPIDVYSFNERTFQVESYTQAVPYDPDYMRSEIGAQSAEFHGQLQFVLPPNISEGAVLLSIPFGTATVRGPIDVGVSSGRNGEEVFMLKKDRPIVLLTAGRGLICEKNLFPVCDGSSIPPEVARPGYKFRVWRDANRILASLLSVDQSLTAREAAPARYKAFSEGWLVGAAALDCCANTFAMPRTDKVTSFCSIGGGMKEHDADSSIELNGVSLIAGLADGITGSSGHLLYGGFFEGATVKSKTKTEQSYDLGPIKGSGRATAFGAGILARLILAESDDSRFAFEFAGRGGMVKNKWNGDAESALGLSIDNGATYCGAQLGTSCGWTYDEKFPIDVFGKYFWTHLNGKKFADEGISLEAIDSHRVRVGCHLSYVASRQLAPWIGGYYERELAGTAKGTVNGAEIQRPSLKGNRIAGEVGVACHPTPFTAIDLLLRGSAGTRDSISGSIRAHYEF
ncbi:MAG: hypothetical protein LBF24_01550 [Puniceicoccales bacterium]|jgi:predicted outer membrane repeat protein|nr:hypothetical protein [Puniceicoccales bacterium]